MTASVWYLPPCTRMHPGTRSRAWSGADLRGRPNTCLRGRPQHMLGRAGTKQAFALKQMVR